MRIAIHPNKQALGAAAAAEGAEAIRAAVRERGACTIVVATGASQFETLDALVTAPNIDWSKVTAFHLDEYVGLPSTHPASFRRYLDERFVRRLPSLGRFVAVNGDEADLDAEVERLNGLLRGRGADVCFAGIGENGHLAFNDPPADFETREPYLVVQLDEACRRQQWGEGWFPSLEAVPERAISMSVSQMLASRRLVIAVPDARKAEAVRAAVEGEVTPSVPASALQRHGDCTLHLDLEAAGLLSPRTRA